MNKKENRMAVRQTVEKAVIRDEQNRRIQSAATNPVKEVLKILHTTLRGLEADTVSVKKKLENLIGQLHAKGHHKLYINENGQIYIQNGDTAEIKDCFDYFPPRNYWDVLISIFQKDELTAKEKDQALELSWMKE